MSQFTIQLMDSEYRYLEKVAKRAGKSVQALVHEWIAQLPEVEEAFDVTQDPIFQIEGYDSEAPADLSRHLDQYIYEERRP